MVRCSEKLDLHMGGNASDPWILLLLSAVAAVGLLFRLGRLRLRRTAGASTSGKELQE